MSAPTQHVHVFIDMSVSEAEDEWLPSLAQVVREELYRLRDESACELRLVVRGFSHELGGEAVVTVPAGKSRGAATDLSVSDVLAEVLDALPRVNGGTSLSPVWSLAEQALIRSERAYVLTDLEIGVQEKGPDGVVTRSPEGLVYIQNGHLDHGKETVERLTRAGDSFLERHLTELGYPAEVHCKRSPTPEERRLKEERDRAFDELREIDDLVEDPVHDTEPELDRAEVASRDGFSGSLPEFLDWLKERLCYGGLHVSEPRPDDWGRMRVTVETVTGGYSSDEHLLARVDRLLPFMMAWRSTHAGGLRVYEFAQRDLRPTSEWSVELAPEGEEPEAYYARVRRLHIVNANGRGEEVLEGYAEGVEIFVNEDPFDTMNPSAVLTIAPVTKERSAWR